MEINIGTSPKANAVIADLHSVITNKLIVTGSEVNAKLCPLFTFLVGCFDLVTGDSS